MDHPVRVIKSIYYLITFFPLFFSIDYAWEIIKEYGERTLKESLIQEEVKFYLILSLCPRFYEFLPKTVGVPS